MPYWWMKEYYESLWKENIEKLYNFCPKYRSFTVHSIWISYVTEILKETFSFQKNQNYLKFSGYAITRFTNTQSSQGCTYQQSAINISHRKQSISFTFFTFLIQSNHFSFPLCLFPSSIPLPLLPPLLLHSSPHSLSFLSSQVVVFSLRWAMRRRLPLAPPRDDHRDPGEDPSGSTWGSWGDSEDPRSRPTIDTPRIYSGS